MDSSKYKLVRQVKVIAVGKLLVRVEQRGQDAVIVRVGNDEVITAAKTFDEIVAEIETSTSLKSAVGYLWTSAMQLKVRHLGRGESGYAYFLPGEDFPFSPLDSFSKWWDQDKSD